MNVYFFAFLFQFKTSLDRELAFLFATGGGQLVFQIFLVGGIAIFVEVTEKMGGLGIVKLDDEGRVIRKYQVVISVGNLQAGRLVNNGAYFF